MISKRQLTQAQTFIISHAPEEWPTLDEFPETDASDLVRTYQENQDGTVPED